MSDVAWGALSTIAVAVCFFGWLAWSDYLDSKQPPEVRDDDD